MISPSVRADVASQKKIVAAVETYNIHTESLLLIFNARDYGFYRVELSRSTVVDPTKEPERVTLPQL